MPASTQRTKALRIALWCLLLAALAAVAASLFSARADLAPYLQRAMAMQWRSFQSDPLPLDTISQIYDMGVVDADNDGRLDLYTANHNYRQHIFLNQGDRQFKDVLSAWGLDQSASLPGIEQSMAPPAIERPGLYIYWLGDTLHLQFHRIESLGPVKGSLHLFNLATVVRNDGVEIRDSVSKLGAIPETRIDFAADRSSHLVLFLSTRGAPMSLRVDAPWARTNTFVGHGGHVPKPYSGFATAPASGVVEACPTCLEFEMALRDRHSMAWSDYNHDGVPDVFINRGALSGTLRSFPESVRARVVDEFLVSKAPGRFADRALELGIEKKDCSGRHVRWVDYDQNGRLDLFINCQDRGNVSGGYPKQFYRQGADGRFEDVAAKVRLDLPEAQLVDLVWFDANGDGRIDLFTHEDTGYYLYRMADGVFVRERVHVGPFHRASIPGLKGETTDYWQFDGKLSVGDYDSDGRLDVFVASKRGNVLLVNAGGGKFKSVDPASIGLPAESVAAVWVDYDNDGRVDLHVVPDGIFRQDSKGMFHRTGLLALPASKYQAAIVNWYDRDNDGNLDVVMALQDNASLWRWWERIYKSGDVKGKDDRFAWQIQSFRRLPRGAAWLQLRLNGPPGNPEAIGARVAVRAKAGAQVRQVGAHDGAFLSQGHYRLYFGLGDDVGPVSLEILWPNGRKQSIDKVEVNRILTVDSPM